MKAYSFIYTLKKNRSFLNKEEVKKVEKVLGIKLPGEVEYESVEDHEYTEFKKQERQKENLKEQEKIEKEFDDSQLFQIDICSNAYLGYAEVEFKPLKEIAKITEKKRYPHETIQSYIGHKADVIRELREEVVCPEWQTKYIEVLDIDWDKIDFSKLSFNSQLAEKVLKEINL